MSNLELAARLRAAHSEIKAAFAGAQKAPAGERSCEFARVIGRCLGNFTLAAIDAEYLDRDVKRPEAKVAA